MRILTALLGLVVATSTPADDPEMRSRDFAVDPGWEGYRNRQMAAPLPVTHQHFGYRPTQLAGGSAPGEIGGRVSRS